MQYILIPGRGDVVEGEAPPSSGGQALIVSAPSSGSGHVSGASSGASSPSSSPPSSSPPSSSPPTSGQHRRHRRTRTDELLVKVRVGDGMVVARVDDISVGGLFARTKRTLPIGAFVELSLLRPGYEELALTAVVVDHTERRAGLALRFEALTGTAAAALRRVVFDQHVRHVATDTNADPDSGVAPAVAMTASMTAQPVARDVELDELRRRVALLQAENERLRVEAQDADESHKLVGRLRLEVERLRARADGRVAVDADIVGELHRDAENAWMALARVVDIVAKLK